MADSTINRQPVTYADAGVNIDQANRTKQRIKYLAHKTFTKNVLSEIGGSAACSLWTRTSTPIPYWSPADGVGTKLKVAFDMGLHHTIGYDLVNHCVNDIAVQGAAPLIFWIISPPANSIPISQKKWSPAWPTPASTMAAL